MSVHIENYSEFYRPLCFFTASVSKFANKVTLMRMETCYTNLANAIILAAAKDHRRALRRLKKYPWDKDAESVRKDCERFFRSGWFQTLTSLDGKVLIEKLHREVYGVSPDSASMAWLATAPSLWQKTLSAWLSLVRNTVRNSLPTAPLRAVCWNTPARSKTRSVCGRAGSPPSAAAAMPIKSQCLRKV